MNQGRAFYADAVAGDLATLGMILAAMAPSELAQVYESEVLTC